MIGFPRKPVPQSLKFQTHPLLRVSSFGFGNTKDPPLTLYLMRREFGMRPCCPFFRDASHSRSRNQCVGFVVGEAFCGRRHRIGTQRRQGVVQFLHRAQFYE